MPDPDVPQPAPPPSPPLPLKPAVKPLSQTLPTLIYGVIAIAILVLIGWGLWEKGGFLKSLQEIPIARGLITFLIAVTTMGIAIMLAISTLFGESGPDDEKTFDKGKQVLSVLIKRINRVAGNDSWFLLRFTRQRRAIAAPRSDNRACARQQPTAQKRRDLYSV